MAGRFLVFLAVFLIGALLALAALGFYFLWFVPD
jgi:hypothetical protein